MNPIINTGIKAVRRAGNLIIRYFDRLDRLTVKRKGYNDFVSEVDRMAEDEMIDIIHSLYPAHRILAEESGQQRSPPHDVPPKESVEWIIDPLDGTTNYLHGHPHFCVSLAVRINDRIEHAIVFDPLRDEIFTASRGQGAQLNNRRIRVSGQRKLGQSIISTGISTLDAVHCDAWMDSFKAVLLRTNTVRYSGSAALDLAYVASGRVDGYWEPGLKIWDIAGGTLLVREAGGYVADFAGQQDFLASGHVVAGNQGIFSELMNIIKNKAGQMQ